MSASDWINLDVGGKKMSTTRSTLTSCPDSVLARMFNPDSGLQPARMVDGVYKLDSNPKYFEVILDWLRHRQLIIPINLTPDGVAVVAEYYGLQDMVERLRGVQKRPDDNEKFKSSIGISLSASRSGYGGYYGHQTVINGLKAFGEREPTDCRNILTVLNCNVNPKLPIDEPFTVYHRRSDVVEVFVEMGGFRVQNDKKTDNEIVFMFR